MAIIAYKLWSHFFNVWLQNTVVKDQLKGEGQVSSNIVIFWLIVCLIYYQVIIVVIVRGILNKSPSLDFPGFNDVSDTILIRFLSLLNSFLFRFDIVFIHTIKMCIIHKAFLADHVLEKVPNSWMWINRHRATLACLITAVTALGQEIWRLIAIIVWIFNVQCHGELSLIHVKLIQVERLHGFFIIIKVINQGFPLFLKVGLGIVSIWILTWHETILSDHMLEHFKRGCCLFKPEKTWDKVFVFIFGTVVVIWITVSIAWSLLQRTNKWFNWNLDPILVKQFLRRNDLVLFIWSLKCHFFIFSLFTFRLLFDLKIILIIVVCLVLLVNIL